MTAEIQAMREKICELERFIDEHKLTDAASEAVERIEGAACILLKSGALYAFAPEAPGLVARAALLKEEIVKYGKLNE